MFILQGGRACTRASMHCVHAPGRSCTEFIHQGVHAPGWACMLFRAEGGGPLGLGALVSLIPACEPHPSLCLIPACEPHPSLCSMACAKLTRPLHPSVSHQEMVLATQAQAAALAASEQRGRGCLHNRSPHTGIVTQAQAAALAASEQRARGCLRNRSPHHRRSLHTGPRHPRS